MDLQLTGKNVLITGSEAGQALGLGFARRAQTSRSTTTPQAPGRRRLPPNESDGE